VIYRLVQEGDEIYLEVYQVDEEGEEELKERKRVIPPEETEEEEMESEEEETEVEDEEDEDEDDEGVDDFNIDDLCPFL